GCTRAGAWRPAPAAGGEGAGRRPPAGAGGAGGRRRRRVNRPTSARLAAELPDEVVRRKRPDQAQPDPPRPVLAEPVDRALELGAALVTDQESGGGDLVLLGEPPRRDLVGVRSQGLHQALAVPGPLAGHRP